MNLNHSSKFWIGRGNILLALHELLFSANIACAVGYALSLYMSRSVGPWTPLNDAGYYFLQGVIRVSDVLHPGGGCCAKEVVAFRIYWNGFTIRTPSISRVSCISSEKTMLHPACLAARKIRASQNDNP
jgi:hypothetical protein